MLGDEALRGLIFRTHARIGHIAIVAVADSEGGPGRHTTVSIQARDHMNVTRV